MLAAEEFPPETWHETLGSTWPYAQQCLPCNMLLHPVRVAVSKRKRRYLQGGFDLDLTYLTDRIIVMGFPSTGIEHMYRNPRYEVRRFLETRHQGHYKVYNLTSEPGRGYDSTLFDGRVERYPFRDHCVPSLRCMVDATSSAKRWLDADPANVVVFHCKAGKGRAGLMSCCMLIRAGVVDTADAAIALYNKTRVSDGKGLTIVSQVRYVRYFERIWRQGCGVQGSLSCGSANEPWRLPPQPTVYISSVRLTGLRTQFGGSMSMLKGMLRIQVHKGTPFKSTLLAEARQRPGADHFVFDFNTPVPVEENFSVTAIRVDRSSLKGKVKLMQLWENTAFVAQSQGVVSYGVSEIDMKKAVRKQLGENVCIDLTLVSEAYSTVPTEAIVVVTSPLIETHKVILPPCIESE